MSIEPPTEALEANAYAIAYRLLGDRPAARAASGIAIERTRASGALLGPHWLAALAAETVAQSVGVAAAGRRTQPPAGTPTDIEEGLRAALRRRLASAGPDERAAAALHHLAGYPIDDVAVAMGRTPQEVQHLVGALSRPPGVSYRLLGDPELLGPPAAEPRRPRGIRRPSVHWTTVAVILVVVGLVAAAGMSVGARPTLGPRRPDSRVQIRARVPSEPSKGCRQAPQPFGTFRGSVGAGPATRYYRLAVPPPTAPSTTPGRNTDAENAPRGLLVALPGYGQSAQEFETASGLEDLATDQGYLVATIDPLSPTEELNVTQDPATPDDAAHTLAVVDDVLAHECVDLHRVDLVGFGAGAQLAGVLACKRPELFATATSVDGGLLTDGCRLDPPVSLLQVWHKDDDVLPLDGGYGPGIGRVAVTPGAPRRPVAEPAVSLMARWGDLIRAGQPTVSTGTDGTVVIDRSGGTAGAAVRSITYPTGGYAWEKAISVRVMEFVREHARST